jgi:hypothetical protein
MQFATCSLFPDQNPLISSSVLSSAVMRCSNREREDRSAKPTDGTIEATCFGLGLIDLSAIDASKADDGLDQNNISGDQAFEFLSNAYHCRIFDNSRGLDNICELS